MGTLYRLAVLLILGIVLPGWASAAEVERIALSKDKAVVSDIATVTTGTGEIEIVPHKEDGKVSIRIKTLEVPTSNNQFCLFCAQAIKLGPNMRFETRAFNDTYKLGDNTLGPKMNISDINLEGPAMDPAKEAEFLEAGPKGALVTKDGKGFVLVEGEAFLVKTDVKPN